MIEGAKMHPFNNIGWCVKNGSNLYVLLTDPIFGAQQNTISVIHNPEYISRFRYVRQTVNKAIE